jgi:hypothetical protein
VVELAVSEAEAEAVLTAMVTKVLEELVVNLTVLQQLRVDKLLVVKVDRTQAVVEDQLVIMKLLEVVVQELSTSDTLQITPQSMLSILL